MERDFAVQAAGMLERLNLSHLLCTESRYTHVTSTPAFKSQNKLKLYPAFRT